MQSVAVCRIPGDCIIPGEIKPNASVNAHHVSGLSGT